MSHFFTLVLIPKDSEERREEVITQLLSPYDENTEVDAYEEKCYCVGMDAESDVRTMLDAEFGEIDDIRTKFFERHPELKDREPYNEEVDTMWKKEVSEPLEKRRIELLETHPNKSTPDAECDSCKGTGIRTTTYNPKSKWDWWTVGGRWSGTLTDYDPSKNEDNQEKCYLCHGTGKRNDALGREARKKDPNYTCNGCDGTGWRIKWPTEWVPYDGDEQLVAKLLALPDKEFVEQVVPYALVTPDGVWYERGEMGWWGISSNDKDKSVWVEIVRKLLNENKECVAVVVDCHI